MKVKEVSAMDHIQSLLENTNMPVAILELNGALIQENDVFHKVFKAEGIENIKELLDKKSAYKWNEIAKFAKKVEHVSYEMMVLQEPGKMVQVTVKVVYCSITKKIIAYFEILSSNQKEIETTRRNLFHKAKELMVLIDRNGIVRDINEACFVFFNLHRSFVINKKVSDFTDILCVSKEKYKTNLKLAVKNGHITMLKRFERSPGDIRNYQITTFYDKETFMFSMIITDQTEKISSLEKLAHTESLSSVGELAASIAHEIRNPLTTLKGFTQLMKVTAEEETMKYLSVIDDEIKRMESILNEMLILSKPGKNEKNFISLQELLSDIILVISPKAKMEDITIEQSGDISLGDSVYGNSIKLKQVLLNLLKNALEAMVPGGKLVISKKKKDDGQLIVVITDTGKGINEAHLKQIFTPFFTTRAEGTGLGLSFVRETIEDHGGTIAVESEVGSGTKFILSFPSAISLVPKGGIDERVSVTVDGIA